jgi:hypothetical protein
LTLQPAGSWRDPLWEHRMTDLATLLTQVQDLLALQGLVLTGNVDILAGSPDDPDSYNAEGGKTGPLGFYALELPDGTTQYYPCLKRLQLDAAAGADPEAVESLLAGKVAEAAAQVVAAQGKVGEAAAQVALADQAKLDAQAAAAGLASTVDQQAHIKSDFDTRRAIAPVGLRDGYPGQPIGVDLASKAVGSVTPSGGLIVGGLEIYSPALYRDGGLAYPLLEDGDGRPILASESRGRLQMRGVTLLPATADRDGSAYRILLEDASRNPLLVSGETGRLLMGGVDLGGVALYRDGRSVAPLLEDSAGKPIVSSDPLGRIFLSGLQIRTSPTCWAWPRPRRASRCWLRRRPVCERFRSRSRSSRRC